MEGLKETRTAAELPAHWESLSLDRVHIELGGTTLFHLRGRRSNKRPVCISTLLHGNETTGFYALQKVFGASADRTRYRDALILIGNPEAAQAGVRHLKSQRDFNRIWKDDPFARKILQTIREHEPIVALDIHNTTGKNPHYGALRSLSPSNLGIASLFSRHVVHFETPEGTFTGETDLFCPSMTIECGQSGPRNAPTVDDVANFVTALLTRDEDTFHSRPKESFDVYRSFARLVVGPDTILAIEGQDCRSAELVLPNDLDAKNFCPFEPGQPLAQWVGGPERPRKGIRVLDQHGADLTPQFLRWEGDQLVVAHRFVPSLLTLDLGIAKSDALGYIMEVCL